MTHLVQASLVAACMLLPAKETMAQKLPPATSGANAEVSCLLIALQISNSPDPKTQEVWSLGVTYFLGRADMARGNQYLLALVDQEVQRRFGMTTAEYHRERERCALLLTATGDALVEVGKHLKTEGIKKQREELRTK